jgi:cytoskeletal protein CcmA (bactofilin family)
MLGKNKEPAIKSLIAQGTLIEGHVRFDDGMRIDGEVAGDVRANNATSSLLVISETASVTGQVLAGHVIINGTVRGPVHASQLLELQPKARIEGDVSYAALEMHQGALITGQLRPIMGGDLEDKPTLKLAANNG